MGQADTGKNTMTHCKGRTGRHIEQLHNQYRPGETKNGGAHAKPVKADNIGYRTNGTGRVIQKCILHRNTGTGLEVDMSHNKYRPG